MTDKKRYVKNFIINPEFQTRLILYFFSASMAITGLMVFFISRYSAEAWTIASNINHVQISELNAIGDVLNKILRTSILFLILGLMLTVVFGIVVSHRIAGPMYAISKYIDQMIDGDYDSKRSLRPYDELNPIMERLHTLAGKMKNGSANK